MKRSEILLWGAVLALAVFTAYQFIRAPKTTLVEIKRAPDEDPAFVLQIPTGHRVHLKSPSTSGVNQFKDLLKTINGNAAGKSGTQVNLRFQTAPNVYTEEQGPLPAVSDSGEFYTVKPIGPYGSMHHTQRVATNDAGLFKAVLDSLDLKSVGTMTSTSTPTPAPSP